MAWEEEHIIRLSDRRLDCQRGTVSPVVTATAPATWSHFHQLMGSVQEHNGRMLLKPLLHEMPPADANVAWWSWVAMQDG